MSRPLAVASAAWAVAIAAAAAGVLLPSSDLGASLALFAFAVALGLLVAILLVADGLRHRRARRHRAAGGAPSPLTRLEYLPSVTTGTRRIRWRGGRYQMGGRRAPMDPPIRPVGEQEAILPVAAVTTDLMGSAARATRAG